MKFRPVLPNGKRFPARSTSATTRPGPLRSGDTLGDTKLDAKVPMTRGKFSGVFQSDKTGLTRFTVKVKPGHGKLTKKIVVRKNFAGSGNGAEGRRQQRRQPQPGLPHRRHRGHQLGRRQLRRHHERRRDAPLRDGGPRRRHPQDPPGGRQRDARTGADVRQHRRRPGHGLAVHGAAEVRHRGLHQRLRRRRRLEAGLHQQGRTRSRRSSPVRWPRTSTSGRSSFRSR